MVVQAVPLQWPLVGREAELGAFAALWSQRPCQGVTLAGGAGVGKSRLAAECMALGRAAEQSFGARRVAASAAMQAVPLGAIAHLLPTGVDLSDPVRGFAEVARALAGPHRHRRHWAVLVDDLNLLDAASAVLLRQLMDAGLVRVIGTLRTAEPVGDAVQALCGGDAVGRIDVKPFTLEQTIRVLQAALGGPVAMGTAHALFTASGGNALYLHELVHGAHADGSLASDGEIWQLAEGSSASTPRLTALINSRLKAADTLARPALELTATCESVSLSDAEAAASGPARVASLEEAGLIQVTTEQRRTTVRLTHPLYAEVIRAQTPESSRRELLLSQVARTRTHGARRREDALHIASWQLAATGTADPALLTRAAVLARYAHDYPQTVTLLEALPQGDHTTFTRIMLGEALFEIGQPDRADQALQAAATRVTGEQEVLAVAMTRTFNLFWSAARSHAALQVNDEARTRVHSDQALRLLRHNEGTMRIPAGEPARGLELLADLEEDAGDAPDPAGWLFAKGMVSVALEMLGRAGEAVAAAERSYATHRKMADTALALHPAAALTPLVNALVTHGQINRAREAAEQGYAELTADRILIPRIWMTIHLGRIDLLAGHVKTARRWFAEAVAQARAHHNATPMHSALCGVAICAALLGDLQAADQALTEATGYPRFEGFLDLNYQAPAWLAAARGDPVGARRLLGEGATWARTRGMVSREALLLTDIARLGGSELAVARLAELAQKSDGTLTPACAHLTAALAAHDPDKLLDTAQELQAIGTDLLAAEAATTSASAYQRASQPRRATAAARIADDCLARCENARTPLLAPAQATQKLSTRERDIATLAAQGASSQDIADALHLSVRTIENHLQHAYTKLGITSRSELAQAVGRAQPTPPP